MTRLLLLACLLLTTCGLRAQQRELTVMTFNIRCGSCEKADDVNHWNRRQRLVADLIRRRQPDLIGLQEAELFQLRDLQASLPDYGAVGVGRDDGKEKGEATAILYRKARFALLAQETLWLSPTPEVVGKGWDAALNRTVTRLRLREMVTGQELVMFNTHFDHQGRLAQAESTRLIARLAGAAGGAGTLPVLVTGDFNYTRTSSAYALLAGVLRDAEQASQSPATGGDMSFNGFGTDLQPGNKIDFIFVNGRFDVLTHAIVKDLDHGLYPSDHFPVESTLRLRPAAAP